MKEIFVFTNNCLLRPHHYQLVGPGSRYLGNHQILLIIII